MDPEPGYASGVGEGKESARGMGEGWGGVRGGRAFECERGVGGSEGSESGGAED